MKKPTKAKTQPVQRIRHGAVSASIWRNDTDKGHMFNVTFQRAYLDGDTWKNSGSFGRKDLLVIGLIAARAFEWIATQSLKAKQTGTSSKSEDDAA